MTPTTAEETLQLTCTGCAAPMRVRASALGKRAACPKCRTPNLIQRPPSPNDVACVHCGAFTNVDPALAGSVRCSGCMMPLPGRDTRTGSRAGFLDVLPVPIAAFLLIMSGWSLTILVPALFGAAGAAKVILGVGAFVNTLIFLCGLGFLLRMDIGRQGLGWLLAIGAILGLIVSVATMSPLGLLYTVLYGAAAALFFSGHGESYVAGGPPGPRIAMGVTGGALALTAVLGVLSYSGARSKQDFKETLATVDARITPVGPYVTSIAGVQRNSRVPAIQAALKECDAAERQVRALTVEPLAILRGRAQIARLRLRAIAFATEPLPEAARIRSDAASLIAEIRAASAGQDGPLAKVAVTEAKNLEMALK
jgi:hypothetical protein